MSLCLEMTADYMNDSMSICLNHRFEEKLSGKGGVKGADVELAQE